MSYQDQQYIISRMETYKQHGFNVIPYCDGYAIEREGKRYGYIPYMEADAGLHYWFQGYINTRDV